MKDVRAWEGSVLHTATEFYKLQNTVHVQVKNSNDKIIRPSENGFQVVKAKKDPSWGLTERSAKTMDEKEKKHQQQRSDTTIVNSNPAGTQVHIPKTMTLYTEEKGKKTPLVHWSPLKMQTKFCWSAQPGAQPASDGSNFQELLLKGRRYYLTAAISNTMTATSSSWNKLESAPVQDFSCMTTCTNTCVCKPFKQPSRKTHFMV